MRSRIWCRCCCCCRDVTSEEWPLSLPFPDEILISGALICFLLFSLQGFYCRWPESHMLSLKCKENSVEFGRKKSFSKTFTEIEESSGTILIYKICTKEEFYRTRLVYSSCLFPLVFHRWEQEALHRRCCCWVFMGEEWPLSLSFSSPRARPPSWLPLCWTRCVWERNSDVRNSPAL